MWASCWPGNHAGVRTDRPRRSGPSPSIRPSPTRNDCGSGANAPTNPSGVPGRDRQAIGPWAQAALARLVQDVAAAERSTVRDRTRWTIAGIAARRGRLARTGHTQALPKTRPIRRSGFTNGGISVHCALASLQSGARIVASAHLHDRPRERRPPHHGNQRRLTDGDRPCAPGLARGQCFCGTTPARPAPGRKRRGGFPASIDRRGCL